MRDGNIGRGRGKLGVATGLMIVGVLTTAPSLVHAGDREDLYTQIAQERYFEYPQTARTFGMAGSSVQTSSNSSSIIGNPAGLGSMIGGEASATYSLNEISGDEFPTGRNVEQQGYIANGLIAMPVGARYNELPEFGNFGLGWTGADAEWDNDTYNTRAKRTQVVGAYALPLNKNLSVAYSLGWTRDILQSRDVFNFPMHDGFRHTIGMQFQQDKGASFGASLFAGHGDHHALFGPGIKRDSSTRQYGIDVGMQTKVAPTTLLAVGVDYRHVSMDGDVISSLPENFAGGDENGNYYNARIGLEQNVADNFVLRAGYRYAGNDNYKYNRVELNPLNGSANYNAWTLGAGYVIDLDSDYFPSVNLDYGVEYRAVARDDWQHVVTLTLPFAPCGRDGRA